MSTEYKGRGENIFSMSEQAEGCSIVVTSTILCASLIYLKILIGTKVFAFIAAERKRNHSPGVAVYFLL